MTDEEAIKQLAIELCKAEGEDPFSKSPYYTWEEWRFYYKQARRAYELGARPKERALPKEG